MNSTVVASQPIPVIRSDPQGVPYVVWPCIAIVIVVAVLAERLGLEWQWTILFAVVGFLLAAFLTLSVSLDPIRKTVTRTHWVCGRWVTYRETISFNEVDAISFRPFKDADSGDMVRVGIRLLDGRWLHLKSFTVEYGPIGCAAMSYARTIHNQTGIRIDDSTG